MKYAPVDVSELGTILGVWAHPDDEVFTSGGLIASALANGQEVIVVTATFGDGGQTSDESKWPRVDLAKIRKSELDDSLAILGLDRHHWLGHKDGHLDSVDNKQAVAEILSLIKDKQIDTIVSFEPDGITGHPDHKQVSDWAGKIAEQLNCRLLMACENTEYYESYGKQLDDKFDIYFDTEKPKLVSCAEADVCLELPVDIANKKFRAIQAHKSQTEGLLKDQLAQKALKKMCKTECFILT